MLWAELKYMHRMQMVYGVFCASALITIWYGVKFEQNKMPMTALIFLVAVLTSGYVHIASIVRGKRMRLFLNLPVRTKSIGELRVLYPIIIWLGLLAFTALLRELFSLFTHALFIPSVANVIYVNGLILINYSLYLIYVDGLHIYRNRGFAFAGGFLWFFIFIAALMPFYILVNFAGAFGQNTSLQAHLRHYMNSMSVAASLNVIGYALYRFSYYLFQKRKTFFD